MAGFLVFLRPYPTRRVMPAEPRFHRLGESQNWLSEETQGSMESENQHNAQTGKRDNRKRCKKRKYVELHEEGHFGGKLCDRTAAKDGKYIRRENRRSPG